MNIRPRRSGICSVAKVARRDRVVRDRNVLRVGRERRPPFDVDRCRNPAAARGAATSRPPRLRHPATPTGVRSAARRMPRCAPASSYARRRQVEAERQHAGRGEARILAVQRDDAADSRPAPTSSTRAIASSPIGQARRGPGGREPRPIRCGRLPSGARRSRGARRGVPERCRRAGR